MPPNYQGAIRGASFGTKLVDLAGNRPFHPPMGGISLELSDARSVDRAALALFGSAFEKRPPVSHSGAFWEEPETKKLTTLRINGHQPKSDLDYFALHLARARADAIVVTGRILRDEPALQYDLQADPRWGDALVRWRRERWGLTEPPWLLILSGSGVLDFSRPVFRGWAKPLVFTRDRAASRALSAAPVPVVADAAPDIRRAISHLQQSRGAQSISIEAGPSTALQLYDEPARIDELLLSVVRQPMIDERAKGKTWTSLNDIRRSFAFETSTDESLDTGAWSFHRFGRNA